MAEPIYVNRTRLVSSLDNSLVQPFNDLSKQTRIPKSRLLDEAVEDLRAYLSPQRINAMAAEYSEIVKPYVYRMPDAQHAPLTQAEYDQVAAGIQVYATYASNPPSYSGGE